MRIKITADSTCDLPPHLCAEYGVELTPLYVLLGEESFADRKEIDAARLFAHMTDSNHTCHTAARNAVEYYQVFQRYQDYDAIIHISISDKLSCSHANAVLAAAEFSNVYVVNSNNLCLGSALPVERAVMLARQGLDAPEIVRQLEAFIPKINGSFIINSLEYLKRGGRCSALSQFGANLLQMKLCLELEDGYIEAGKKYRGTFAKCLEKYLAERFADLGNVDDEVLFFATTGLEPEQTAEIRAALEELNFFKRIEYAQAGCVISCHSGPCACGLFFAMK